MRYFIFVGILLLTCVQNRETVKGGKGMALGKDFDLNELPEVMRDFSALPYLEAATHLQKMPPRDRIQRLQGLAEKDDKMKVMVLCRMLFTAKKNAKFRAPGLGLGSCVGGSKCTDWPLLPIEIVDGIPFVVVMNYQIEGFPEPSLDYLRYCVDNCEWSTTKFAVPGHETKTRALEKLLASPKWKSLTDDARNVLRSQVK